MQNTFSKERLFLLIIAVLLEILGNFLGFYNILAGYDLATHFIGGALVTTFAIEYFLANLKKHSYLINIVFTAGIGGLWEITEFLADTLFGWSLQRGLQDTIIDMIMVVSAAIIINFLYYMRRRN